MASFAQKASMALAALVMVLPAAFAQQSPLAGIAFKLGDDVETVKAALKTNIDPEPMESLAPSFANMNAGKTFIFLRTKGIRVFFNKKGIAETIRFDPPFSGEIGGVKLGDTEKKVRELKGKPIKAPSQFGMSQTFQYALDDTAYVRFDINDNDGVQAIFVTK